jgi:hypothetical protein
MMMASNQSNHGYNAAPLHIETFLQGAGLYNNPNFYMNHSSSNKNRMAAGSNLSTTTTPLNHQRRVVKHNKAFSLNQTGRVAPMIYTGGAIPVFAQPQLVNYAQNGS